jgi:hypothetical protein
MILTYYYKFEHLPGTTAKTRMDCTASTGNYQVFEGWRNQDGELFVYLNNVPHTFSADAKRRADKMLTKAKGKSISSMFVPDVTLPFAYGDVKGTMDAILIIHNEDYSTLEIFVANGQKNNRLNLWQMLSDGEFDDEIAELRRRAVTESTTQTDE